jgi:hypothetical protein
MLAAIAVAGCRGHDFGGGSHGTISVGAPDRLRCTPEVRNCEVATGSVLAVEAVDPDGDGDAHLVLLSREGVTAPGITVIDVARDLRPQPLPASGDRVSAVGPVYPGSYGQRQIQATELRVTPAGD